ncbi:permease [Halobacillus sp. A5]|uniref:permease n=1 Tax=Halobacillus sp. A5 TaxID=2880263 RepID=UPI0020A6C647|nr:permease [Halobacillus sp. A5]MCP3029066.1 permease [Halobacillus sp. A5]
MYQEKSLNNKWGYILLFLFFLLFIYGDLFPAELITEVIPSLLDMNTIFLSIVLEAIPFVLLGVFVSALIQSFVKEETLERFIPSNPILALFPAVTIGAIFPVCECAIVPIVRRLIQKGMPLHVGIVILVSAPVLNPIVFLSTFYAFQTDLTIAWARMGLAFIVAIIVGGIIYSRFKNSWQLKEPEGLVRKTHEHEHRNKIAETFYHASDEFFDMGKFLIIGALLASMIQTFMDRELLVGVGSGFFTGPAVMMGLAYFLSLCSEADAFVASSFNGLFSSSSILGFLVYGPMTDLKNTILMAAYFRKRFVISFVAIVTVVTYIITILFDLLY